MLRKEQLQRQLYELRSYLTIIVLLRMNKNNKEQIRAVTTRIKQVKEELTNLVG